MVFSRAAAYSRPHSSETSMPQPKNARNTPPREQASDERWYCVQTAPARETMAAEYLRSKSLNVYNPVLPGRSSPSGKKRSAPLFPRYVFARFAVDRDFEAVRYGQGIASVVRDMAGPLPVPDAVIEEIRRRVEDGFYSRAQLEAGEGVMVESGAFRGVTGIFHAYASGRERVRVLMELMNRSVVVECDVTEVRKCPRGAARH
jgi:transcriptional antiterminator RfaH